MKNRSSLFRQISEQLMRGEHFANYMSLISDEPVYDILSYELESASNWIHRIDQQSEPQYLEEGPDIVRLLKSCADVTRDCRYDFLAADFEKLADDANQLISEFEALEGQAQ